MKKRRLAAGIIYHLLVGAMAIVMIYPLLWLLGSSFKPVKEIYTTAHSLIPQTFFPQNYINGWRGFAGVSFSVFFKNSALISVVGTIGAVLSSAVVAFGFGRLNFKGRNVWFVLMLLTMMLPGQVIMIPQYIIFNRMGWVGSFLPLLIPPFFSAAFFVFLIIQFIYGIPKELDEAAKIDGCSYYGIFSRIILPLIVPAMVTCAIFSFMWKWEDFLSALLYLNKPTHYTVSIALKMFSDPSGSSDWGAMFAMSILSLLPVLTIFIFFQKYLVEGISTDGLKG